MTNRQLKAYLVSLVQTEISRLECLADSLEPELEDSERVDRLYKQAESLMPLLHFVASIDAQDISKDEIV
nr:hypothetical protein 4 [Piscirickettsiaceae bacterium]